MEKRYDVVALGELLIDFTENGTSAQGNPLMEANPDNEYVLGMQVFADEPVSSDINLIVLKPEIQVPMLSLQTTGVEPHQYTSASPAA